MRYRVWYPDHSGGGEWRDTNFGNIKQGSVFARFLPGTMYMVDSRYQIAKSNAWPMDGCWRILARQLDTVITTLIVKNHTGIYPVPGRVLRRHGLKM